MTLLFLYIGVKPPGSITVNDVQETV